MKYSAEALAFVKDGGPRPDFTAPEPTPPLKCVAVFGATGAQGGAVVAALVEANAVDIVALTRKPDSEKARALAAASPRVRVVRADMDEPASLAPALAGCDGAFVVTNFWEHFDEAREERQATAALDACKAAGVARVVFSTLEDVAALNGGEGEPGSFAFGKIPPLASGQCVPHFDGKGRAMAHAKTLGLNCVYLKLSYYMENFATLMPPSKNDDGTFAISLPMGPAGVGGLRMGLLSVRDVGGLARAFFADPDAFPGWELGAAGDVLTVGEIAETFGDVFGKTVVYREVELEAYKALGFPGAGELGNMFRFYQDEGRCVRSRADTVGMFEGTQTLRAWLEANKGHPKWKEIGLVD